MLEYEIAANQINRLIRAGPCVRDVCHGEGHVIKRQFVPGLREHAFRKVEREDLLTNLRKKRRVFPGATANLKHRAATKFSQRMSGDNLIKVASQVSILIVCGRPFCVGLLNVHAAAATPYSRRQVAAYQSADESARPN
jgi:hypothetical protein